nr:PREDICTED: uncharacterized protein LOC108213462 [Daucus carota subsp. sativus]
MESQLLNDSAPYLDIYSENYPSPSSSPLLPKNLTKLIWEDDLNLSQFVETNPGDLKEQFMKEIVEDTPDRIIEQYVKPKNNTLKLKKLQFEDPTGMLQIYLPQIVGHTR